MEHPTEFAIEQYVLNAPEGRPQAYVISEHLTVCETCNALAQEIRAFYEAASERLHGEMGSDAASRRALITRRELQHRHMVDIAEPVHRHVPATFSKKLLTLARQHPVASGTSVFGVIAVAVLSSLFVLRPGIDRNPSYSTINVNDGLVSFYNAKNQVILTTPWRVVNSAEAERNSEWVLRQILVAHPQGSKENVIITSLKLGIHAGEPDPSAIRFLNGEGEELLSLPRPDGRISFRGRRYDSPMEARAVLISAYEGPGATELLSNYSNGRSPVAIQRADMRGNAFGVVWHFGVLEMDTAQFDPSGGQYVLMYGLNDVDDYSRMGDAVITLVDPKKISGVTESSATRGFGFATSDAEQYYLSLPLPDAALVTSTRMMVSNVRRTSPSLFDAFVGGDEIANQPGRRLGYNAIIDTAMRVIEIKPNDALIDLHRQLYAEGKLRTPLSDVYLKALAARTRYWTGKDWSDRYTNVRHDRAAGPRASH